MQMLLQTFRLMITKDFFFQLENQTENICQQINNLCTQICVPTQDNSFVCQCHDDYELLEDNITCVRKAAVIDNEISTTYTNTSTKDDGSNTTK